VKIIAVYIGVVLIWSTTPLAIKWSNSSLSFMAAVSLRMLIAALICVVLLVIFRKKLIRSRRDWHAMLAGALGLFPNMALVYWSAQFIPSGLISVVFGVYPFMVGVFSVFILKENPFNFSRVLALIIALVGLLVIHLGQLNFGDNALYGIIGLVVSTLFFALSTVWLKSLGGGIEPLRQLAGTLLIATPCFAITWLFFDGELPTNIDTRSIVGVTYLVVAGSIFGGLGFYYVLRHCLVSTVALIPLMTPVVALMVGYFIEGEVLNNTSILGSFLVLFSLAVYQGALRSFEPNRMAAKITGAVSIDATARSKPKTI